MGLGLLQRGSELAALERRLRQVREGSGAVTVVEGSAGVGKSSLLRAATRTAQSTGFRVLRAWGAPLEQEAGWGVVRQLFAPVSQGAEWDRLGVGAAALASRVLDPDQAAPAPGGDAVHAASHGLTWLAHGLAEESPTLLVVDDVHWADAPSVRWLALLARQVADVRLGVLCAVRSGEPPTDPASLAELLATSDEPPVQPRSLGPEAVESIVAERLPAAGPAFAHACHAASAGNPFLLGALLDQMRAEGQEPTAELASRLTTFGPSQVARSVELQLARLPVGATELARAFTVLGREVPLRQAAALAGLDATQAHRVADHLLASGLLVHHGDGYSLAHPLVAAALYQGVPPAASSALHRRAVTVLAAERADVETLGLHLLRTEPASEPTTVTTLRAAAGQATVRGAPESAAVYLRRALREPPADPSLTADLTSELGLNLAAHVLPGSTDVLSEAVESATTPQQRVRIALSGARALGLAGYFADASDLCRRGLASVSGPTQQRAELELELVCNLLLHPQTVSEAAELLRRRAPLESHGVLWRVGAAWEALDRCDRARIQELLAPVVPEVTPPRNADSLVSTWVKFLLISTGDVQTSLRLCDRLVDLALSQGWLIALAHGSFLRAIALMHLGRVHEARVDAQRSFEFKLAGSPQAALLWSLFPLVSALTESGALEEAEQFLERGGCRVGLPAPSLSGALLLEERARLRLAEGRVGQAREDLTTAAAWWQGLRVDHPGIARWRVLDSEARFLLDDAAGARCLAEEQLRCAERAGVPEPIGAGLRALARTADSDRSVALLEDAVQVLADSPAGLEHTRVLVDLGAALRRANHRAAAREPLRQALDRADRDGMRLLATRARQELVACGARPRRAAATGKESLTPAEREVASLAAAGLSNKEIAQRLFVTRRTVETHLTHVFAKLRVDGRAQLAGLFEQPVCG